MKMRIPVARKDISLLRDSSRQIVLKKMDNLQDFPANLDPPEIEIDQTENEMFDSR